MAQRYEWIAVGLVHLAGLITSGCDRPSPPWQGKPSGSVIDPSKPFLAPSTKEQGWLPGGSGGAPGQGPKGAATKSRAGGLWARCYEGFKPVADPADAVTRLGLMCGPVNGMQQHGATLQGQLQGGPTRHDFDLKQGECYRIFAVASEGVANLDLRVFSGRGTLLHKDRSHHRWPIVEASRPFCSFADDRFRVEVTSSSGKGHYALQVWRLPATVAR